MTSTVLEKSVNRPQGDSVESNIGNTPLIRLHRLTRDLPGGVEVLAKAEHLNPSGSVKDRAALGMILAGERSGSLQPGMTILDATSGNTGIAYAMIAAARSYPVTICLPKNAGRQRKLILRSFGVELIETDPLLSTDGAQLVARRMFEQEPEKYFYPDQYNNPANWRAHYETTAMEIWRQTDGQVTHFVAGMGTSGTFMGVTKRLKELNPAIQCISMQPNSPLHGLEGMKHMASALVPGIYDPNLADDLIEVATEDAHRMVLRLAREEGILVGVSSGGNLVAAMNVAEELQEGVVVAIFFVSAAKYLSEDFWHETAPPSFEI